MTKAATPSDFPPRALIERSDDARSDLPDIEWQAYLAHRYQHMRSVGAIGSWQIGHPRDTTHGPEPVKISYTSPLDEGENLGAVMEKMDDLEKSGLGAGDIEWVEQFNKMHAIEIGYAVDQDAARAVIEAMRRQSESETEVDILKSGGYRFKYNLPSRDLGLPDTSVYEKRDEKGGAFTVFFTPGACVHLTHEKKSSQHCTNLLQISRYEVSSDGFLMQFPMSPEVASPLAAVCKSAVALSNTWRPHYRASPKKRASI